MKHISVYVADVLIHIHGLLHLQHTHSQIQQTSKTSTGPVRGGSYLLDEGVVVTIVLCLAVGGGRVHVE